MCTRKGDSGLGSAVGSKARRCTVQRRTSRHGDVRTRRCGHEGCDGALSASEYYLRSNSLPSCQLAFEFAQGKHCHNNPSWHELPLGVPPLSAEATFRFSSVSLHSMAYRGAVALARPVHRQLPPFREMHRGVLTQLAHEFVSSASAKVERAAD